MGVILPFLRAVPIWAWALAAMLAWGGWQKHRATSAADELLKQQKAVAAQQQAEAQQAISEKARQLEAQAKVSDEATKQATVARADAARAADALRVLRARSAASAAGAASAAAAGDGEAAAKAAGVFADLLGQCADRVRTLAVWADSAHTAGIACERSYEALTK